MTGAAPDHAKLLGLLGVERSGKALQDDAGEPDDRIERRAQLV